MGDFGAYSCNHHHLDQDLSMESTPPPNPKFLTNNPSPLLMQAFNNGSPGDGGGVGSDYIEHTVSKFDTLAGVAIKYGVEVFDIKRMNGLTTDLQMFALKSLQIPLPGRHPPSPIIPYGAASCEATPPPNRRHSDSFELIKTLKLSSSTFSPPATNSLGGYHGLKSNDQNGVGRNRELAWSRTIRKSKSLANDLSETCGKETASDTLFETLVRRRKSEDNSSTKASSSAAAFEPTSGVRKSSSTPSFQDSEYSPSMWPTAMLNLTADAVTRPMLPIPTRKNKAARD